MPFSEGYLHSPEYQRWAAMQQYAMEPQQLLTPGATLAKMLQGGVAAYGAKKSQAQYDAKQSEKANLLASLLQKEPVSDVAVTPALSDPETSGADLQQRQQMGAYNQPTSQAPDTSQMLAKLLAMPKGDAQSELVNQLAPQIMQQQFANEAQANQPMNQYQRATFGETQKQNAFNQAQTVERGRRQDIQDVNAAEDSVNQALRQSRLDSPAYKAQVAEASRPPPEYAGAVAGAESQAKLPAEIDLLNAKTAATGATLDDPTLELMADQYLAGDKAVMQNLGRGTQGAANIVKLRGKIAQKAGERNWSGQDIANSMAEFNGLLAGERTLGNRTANVGMAVNEAKKMAPLALDASAKVNRTQFPSLNAVILAGERGTGDENAVRLGIATNSLINIYARAISPTGVPTVSDKDHARELLSSAWSKGQYNAGVDQLMKEMDAASQAPGMVREEFRRGTERDQTSSRAPPPPSSNGWKIERVQ